MGFRHFRHLFQKVIFLKFRILKFKSNSTMHLFYYKSCKNNWNNSVTVAFFWTKSKITKICKHKKNDHFLRYYFENVKRNWDKRGISETN